MRLFSMPWGSACTSLHLEAGTSSVDIYIWALAPFSFIYTVNTHS